MDRAKLAKVLGVPDLPAYLEKLDIELQKLSQAAPAGLKTPLDRLIRGNGKRLRPAILITAAVSSGQPDDDQTIKAAAAIELVHLASLVHDDILDSTAVRRNLPTANKREGMAIAILAGDFLLAKACGLAAAANQATGVVVADTIALMADGAAQELSGSQSKPLSRRYFGIVRKKTGALFAAAASLGAVCAGAPDQDAKSLGRFGEAFGVAFQIIDDLADYDIPKDLAGEALNQVRLYNTRAVNSLKDLDPSPATAGLARLPNFYLTWVMEIQNVIV